MLTKRTNILFNEDMWFKLAALAKTKNTSVGDLVREAVAKTFLKPEETIQARRKKAVEEILKLRSKMKFKTTPEEIKEMINYGRKY